MEFVRKKRRGQQQSVSREWVSDDGHYRIVWRREVYGVKVRPGYHPLVRSINNFGFEFWSFAGARRPYKTLDLAKEACEKNRRLWEAFCKIAESERKGRADRVRALDAKATLGSGASAHKIMSVLPIWVKEAAEPFLIRILFPVGRRWADDDECDESDPSPGTSLSDTSDTSAQVPSPETDSTTQLSSPVSNAKVEAESTTRKTSRTRSRETSSADESNAPPAKGRAKVPTAKPKRPTKRRSRATAKA